VEVTQAVAQPGVGISRDIRASEKQEADITKLIERRHNQRVEDEGERKLEEEWQITERRHAAERQKQLALEWLEYHQQRLEGHKVTAAVLQKHHEVEIERYRRLLGLPEAS
jgi:hypothetical protein